MQQIAFITLKGIIRDRILHAVGMGSLLFLFIPIISSLSMRQVTELSVTLSVSIISFLLFVLSIFLGGTLIWKDIERRYTFSVLSMPISRSGYLFGKFSAVAALLAGVAMLLFVLTYGLVMFSASMYPPDRPVAWDNIFLCVLFDALKYILIVAVAFLFSTISTSLFLPMFGTIAIYFAGNASQQVYEYISAGGGKQLPTIIRGAAQALYYVLPNLSSFNLKFYAIYGVAPSFRGIALTFIYFVVYTAIVLVLAALIFSRREIN